MKFKKKFSFVFLVVIIGLSIYLLIKLVTFNLFDSKIIVLEEFKVKNKNYNIKISHSPSNATIQSSIQIIKIENQIEEVICDFERYNYLKNFMIKNDSIFLIVDDTLRNHVKEKLYKIKLP